MKRNTAILQMLYGEKSNLSNFKSNDTYKNLLRVSIETENDLRKKLEDFPELAKLYEKAAQAANDLYLDSLDTYFSEGFRLGFLMCLDVLDD